MQWSLDRKKKCALATCDVLLVSEFECLAYKTEQTDRQTDRHQYAYGNKCWIVSEFVRFMLSIAYCYSQLTLEWSCVVSGGVNWLLVC